MKVTFVVCIEGFLFHNFENMLSDLLYRPQIKPLLIGSMCLFNFNRFFFYFHTEISRVNMSGEDGGDGSGKYTYGGGAGGGGGGKKLWPAILKGIELVRFPLTHKKLFCMQIHRL